MKLKVIKHKGNWGILIGDEDFKLIRKKVLANFQRIPEFLHDNYPTHVSEEDRCKLSEQMRTVSKRISEIEREED